MNTEGISGGGSDCRLDKNWQHGFIDENQIATDSRCLPQLNVVLFTYVNMYLALYCTYSTSGHIPLLGQLNQTRLLLGILSSEQIKDSCVWIPLRATKTVTMTTQLKVELRVSHSGPDHLGNDIRIELMERLSSIALRLIKILNWVAQGTRTRFLKQQVCGAISRMKWRVYIFIDSYTSQISPVQGSFRCPRTPDSCLHCSAATGGLNRSSTLLFCSSLVRFMARQ